jgi:hypothetical protein
LSGFQRERGRRAGKVVLGPLEVGFQQGVKGLSLPEALDFPVGGGFETGGKGIVPSAPEDPVGGPGAEREVVKTDLLVLHEVDGCPHVFLGVRKEPYKLALIIAVPTGILDLLKALGLDLLGEFFQGGETGWPRGGDGAEGAVGRHLDVPHAGDDIDPGKNQPTEGAEGAEGGLPREFPTEEVGGEEDAEISEPLKHRNGAASQADAEDGETENKKDIRKHERCRGRRHLGGGIGEARTLWGDGIFVKKGEEFVRPEVGQHQGIRLEGRDAFLAREGDHDLAATRFHFDVADEVVVTEAVEEGACLDAPRAPISDKEFKFHAGWRAGADVCQKGTLSARKKTFALD